MQRIVVFYYAVIDGNEMKDLHTPRSGVAVDVEELHDAVLSLDHAADRFCRARGQLHSKGLTREVQDERWQVFAKEELRARVECAQLLVALASSETFRPCWSGPPTSWILLQRPDRET